MRLGCPPAGIDYTMLMLVISPGGISCLVSAISFSYGAAPTLYYTLSIIDYILQREHTYTVGCTAEIIFPLFFSLLWVQEITY